MSFTVRPIDSDDDREWVRAMLRSHWGGEKMASRGEIFDASALPGFVAVDAEGVRVGLVTYRVLPQDCCDLGVIESLQEGAGVGTALLDAVARVASGELGCSRLRAITTNDNQRALGWYRRRGFNVVQVREGAVDEARRSLKPTIPPTNADGVPIRDEIELERVI
jgi:ribosomal protein S18 acetylase RimI-like enzyme